MNILYVSMHPAPYRDPVLKYAKERLGDKLDIVTLYPNQTTHKEWKLKNQEYEHIPLTKLIKIFGKLEYHPQISSILRKRRYDIAFVQGYSPLTSLVVYCYMKIKRRKIIYCVDTALTKYGSSKCRYINYLSAKNSDALWVPGTAARLLWESKDISPSAIYEGMYTLDWENIQNNCDQETTQEISRVIDETKGKYTYLFIGNFIESRNILSLLKAYSSIFTNDTSLIVIGKGEQYQEVEEYINEHNNENIHLIPGVPFDQIHQFYLNANAYVHPGMEPYSVALQEAVLAGVPTICTKEVGAGLDFVKSNVNGLIIDNNDDLQLKKALIDIRNINPSKMFVKNIARERGLNFAIKQFDSILDFLENSVKEE